MFSSMKYINFSLFFCLIFQLSQAQSLQINTDASTKNNNTNTFTINGADIPVSNSNVTFENNAAASDISNSGISAILGEDISVYDSGGKEINTVAYKRAADDNSSKIYVANNGAMVVRENIANFLIYDSAGRIQKSLSNSSQSSEGESVSQFAADPAFKTQVLYNPEIISGGVKGSRARIIKQNGTLNTFFDDNRRAIRFVEVSENGQFIAVASHQNNNNDEVYIADRFGNEINTIAFDQSVKGVRFSDDGTVITVYSNSRAGVYDLVTGKREGSTSFRTPLQIAEYFPEDDVILAVTANESNNVLSNIEFHAINIAERKIERRDFGEALGITELIPQNMSRTGKYNYNLSGLSKNLTIKVSF